TVAYSLGNRNKKQLYSKTHKRKHTANLLKIYKYYLYNLGFTEKALSDLDNLFQETKNPYMKRALAWELALWYANKHTKIGALKALEYVPFAALGETDPQQLRKLAVMEAECYGRVGAREKARKTIDKILKSQN